MSVNGLLPSVLFWLTKFMTASIVSFTSKVDEIFDPLDRRT